jgi:hypothetical protein
MNPSTLAHCVLPANQEIPDFDPIIFAGTG